MTTTAATSSFSGSTLLVQPLFNVLLLLYIYLPGHDLGVGVIVFTILIRLLLWPLFSKSIRSQLMMSKIQPEIEAVQKKYQSDKQTQVAELMKLYQQHNFNPFSGIIFLFLQLPILLAVYHVFQLLNQPFSHLVYSGIPLPLVMDYTFLGWFDLSQPFLLATAFASLIQFVQVWESMRKLPQAKVQTASAKASRLTTYLSPVLTFVIFRSFPSVLSLYWSVSSLVSLFQQWLIQRKMK
jgi:YidC/Oxa1 family membrane protein insertase